MDSDSVNMAVCKSKQRRKVMSVCSSNIVRFDQPDTQTMFKPLRPEILHNNIQGITSYLTANTLHVHYK